MSAKRNVLKSQLPLIVVAATVCLLALMWFVYRGLGRSRCDNIFQQAADKMEVSLKVINTEGKVALGQEKVQELTDSSQKVVAHLKTCCQGQQLKMLNAEQFQICVSGAKDYQTQIIQVAASIKEADAAEKQQKPELAKQKTAEAKEGANKLLSTEKTLAKAIETPSASPSVKAGGEQESNNTIPQANVAEMGTTVAGEINPADDVDFFKFTYDDAKKRRDIVRVGLDPSTTLKPSLALHKEDRSIDRPWKASNTAGAENKFEFVAEPGKTYYVGVASDYGQTAGAYTLSLKPQRAYDQYEPNEDAFTPTALKVGQTVEANIMDGADKDSYRLSGVKEKNFTIHLQNLSPKLQPAIRVLKSDRSILQNWKSADTGADLNFSVTSEPGQEYFVEVAAAWGNSEGPYKLKVE